MANKPEEFPQFSQLDPFVVKVALQKLNLYLSGFSSQMGITEIVTYQDILYELIERIEKRRIYFHIFYNGCRMGELNGGALMCFWILKLSPFYHASIPANNLNPKIALYLFLHMLSAEARRTGKQINSNNQTVSNLYYAFRYRDISKESLMLLAESLLY
jgi:hypothetical protein